MSFRLGCRCVELLMHDVAKKDTEIMVASHNQRSMEKAVALMQQLDMRPSGAGAPNFPFIL